MVKSPADTNSFTPNSLCLLKLNLEIMGRVFMVELQGRAYRCRYCHTALALADNVISRSFSCRQGRAYLFENAVNISVGNAEKREMLSGAHTVADIFCCSCGQLLGWKYMEAHDNNQKYKEGKVVLERWRIIEDGVIEYSLPDIPHQSSVDAEYS